MPETSYRLQNNQFIIWNHSQINEQVQVIWEHYGKYIFTLSSATSMILYAFIEPRILYKMKR